MKRMTFVHACVLGVALAATGACNGNNGNSNTAANTPNPGTPAATTPAAPAGDQANPPVTVTGCLQRGNGSHDFILTRVNEPSRSVGTTGETAATPEREQLRAAEHAYRIDPQNDVKLDDLVGKQVRVTGTIAERSDLEPGHESPAGTSGSADRNDRKRAHEEIKEKDLSKISASDVTMVSNSCGQARKRVENRKKK